MTANERRIAAALLLLQPRVISDAAAQMRAGKRGAPGADAPDKSEEIKSDVIRALTASHMLPMDERLSETEDSVLALARLAEEHSDLAVRGADELTRVVQSFEKQEQALSDLRSELERSVATGNARGSGTDRVISALRERIIASTRAIEGVAADVVALQERVDARSVGFPWRGEWAALVDFKKGDFVTHHGSMWYCRRDHRATASKPPEIAKELWGIAVSRGASAQMNASYRYTLRVNSDTVLPPDSTLVLVDSSAGPLTLTLPVPALPIDIYVKKNSSDKNKIRVTSEKLVDEVPTKVLRCDNTAVHLVYDNGWWIV